MCFTEKLAQNKFHLFKKKKKKDRMSSHFNWCPEPYGHIHTLPEKKGTQKSQARMAISLDMS